jgi:hypothetical protein
VTREEKAKQLKVTDRRMFTADGKPRAPREAEEGTAEECKARGVGVEEVEETGSERDLGSPEGAGQAESEKTDMKQPGEGSAQASTGFSGPLPEPGFGDLVSILAEPIALFLGDVSLPDGRSAENLDLARFHIDLLAVLKRKTDSNLSQEESAVLDDLLYRLRMRYVQKSE